MEQIKRHTNLISILIIIVVVFVSNIIFANHEYLVNGDAFSSIAVPAYFAGYRWEEVLQHASFHGYGNTIILVPLYQIIGNHFYKIYEIEFVVFRVLNAILVYMLCKKLGQTSRRSLIIAILMDLLPVGDVVGNQDVVLISINLLIINILFTIKKSSRNRYLKICIVLVLLFGAVFIHGRYVVTIAAAALSLLFWFCTCGKSELSRSILYRALIIVAFGIAVFILFDQVNNIIVEKLYSSEIKVANQVPIYYYGEYSKRYIYTLLSDAKKAIRYFASEISCWIFYSFGLILPILYLIVCNIVRCIKTNHYNLLLFIQFFFLSGFFIVLVLFALRAASVSGTYNKNYTFIRYNFYFYHGLFLTAIICWLKADQTTSIAFVFLNILSSKWFIANIVPILSMSKKSSLTSFLSFVFFEEEGNLTRYFTILMLISTIVPLILILSKKAHKSFMLLVMLLLLCIENRRTQWIYANDKELDHIATIDASEEIINSTSCSNYNLYVIDSPSFAYILQLRFPSIEFGYVDDINVLEDMDYENGIVAFSPKRVEYSGELMEIQIDSNEYMYCDSDFGERWYLDNELQ